jgi:hypothetical protein
MFSDELTAIELQLLQTLDRPQHRDGSHRLQSIRILASALQIYLETTLRPELGQSSLKNSPARRHFLLMV